MPGQTDLKKILESIDPYLVDESFIFMTTDQSLSSISNTLNPIASFKENEGLSIVITQATADKNAITYDSVFSCISLGVHSSLESYGLISTISRELTQNNISTNVFSGYYHDHIFVQSEKADKALEIISKIGSS
jgi:hypothetical protein|tara:strand:- start:253 stop:654 length:402 start_codon:yes stop_codon:yes gene_type:complete